MTISEGLTFTGERYMPSETGKIRLEHYHRYACVKNLTRGKRVLDVACGEGYGTFLLSNLATSVVGVDISMESIAHAKKVYNSPRLQFQQGNILNLEFPDSAFDLVISFETLEHLAEQKQMMNELKRVLTPNGVLVVSSPNRPVYNKNNGKANEYHVKELDFSEFNDLLDSYFSEIEFYGQRIQICSLIQPLKPQPTVNFDVWYDDGNDIESVYNPPLNSEYFLAVCSDRKSDTLAVGSSALYPEAIDLVDFYVGFAKWAQALEKIVNERNAEIVRLKRELELNSKGDVMSLLEGRPDNLSPIMTMATKTEYDELSGSLEAREITARANKYLEGVSGDALYIDGFCIPCDQNVPFLVDLNSGGQLTADGKWLPNWRERLECPKCAMNNRQRLIAGLVNQFLEDKQSQSVYFMEQITPIYKWAVEAFSQHKLIGSEYLGHEYKGGVSIQGIRHEDVEALSFDSESLDLIVSNDVFEHVPNPEAAFNECFRVLKSGGVMLAAIPFHANQEKSVIRAKLENGKVENILPPIFHGNPVLAEGSLVFTDFGWQMLDSIKTSGFTKVEVEAYSDFKYGHVGPIQIIFRAVK